jgi:hypothetical protein
LELNGWLISDGGFKLPNVARMQKDVPEWKKCMKRYSGSIGLLYIWYNDQLSRDIWDATVKGRKAFLLTCSTFKVWLIITC